MKTIIQICICLFLANNTLGQVMYTFTGVILNAVSNQPVEFAAVILIAKDSSYINGTISDSNGNFKFQNVTDRHATLVIKHLNYNDTTIAVLGFDKDYVYNILVKPRNHNIEEVVVAGEQTQARVSLSKLNFIVTDRIKNQSALALDVIDRIPIAYVDFNENIWINGSNKVLVLVNGIEIPDKGILNQITPSMIQRVEVDTSPSSKYSNKDYTAVINIIATRPSSLGSSINMKLSPTNDFYDANTGVNYVKNNHNLYGLYKLYFRNYEEEINTTYIFGTSTMKNSLLTFPRKEMDNEFFYGYYYTMTSNTSIGFNGYSSIYRENFDTKFNDKTLNSYKSFEESFTTNDFQTYYKTQDTLFNLSIVLTLNQKSLKDNNYLIINRDLEIRQEKITKIGGCLDLEKNFKQLTSTLGVECYHFKANEEYENSLQHLINQDYLENRLSSYVDVSQEFQKRGIRVGLNFYFVERYFNESKNSVRDMFLFPGFSYIEKLNSKNSIKISLASSLKSPNLWQLLSVPLTIDSLTSYSGNPYLKPERRLSLSSEYSYSSKGTYVGITGFYRVLTNSIHQIFNISEVQRVELTYQNVNKIYEFGTSHAVTYSLFKWWIIKTNTAVYYQQLPKNMLYYNTENIAWYATISCYWPITPKLLTGLTYSYYSSRLTHYGWYKPYNSNLFLIRYKYNNTLNASIMVTQPFGKFQSKSYTNYGSFIAVQENSINVRTVVFSINLNLSKKNNEHPDNLYYNEDKKY